MSQRESLWAKWAEPAIRCYTKGVICPSVLWEQVLAGLVDIKELDALSPEMQEQLRQAYKDRPRSLDFKLEILNDLKDWLNK